jgi:hypothetical protein
MDAPPQQDIEQTKHRIEIINQPNIDAILEDRGHATVGRVGVECVAAAGSSYDDPVMPVRRDCKTWLSYSIRIKASIPSITNTADPEEGSLTA